MLGPEGVDVVVNLDVDTEEVLRRIAGRRVCLNCKSSYNVVDNPPKNDEICDVCGEVLVQRDDDTEDGHPPAARNLRVRNGTVGRLVLGAGAAGPGRCRREP